ncbi:MAG: tripartite tricarboxylate transporter TctB family protein [Syntrophaceae bacterium]|nr:tripartite tricarboxylate transporter TctB family protein [Syntrophaceae bacterium]
MKNLTDILGSLFLILLGIGAIIGAIGLRVGTPTEPQPGFFPFLSGAIIVILSSIIFVQGWLGRSKRRIGLGEIKRPAMLIAVLAAFVAVLEPLGYVLASPFLIAVVLRIMGIKSWRALLVTSLVLSIGTYLLFDWLLGITLPAGILTRFGL